MTEIEIEQIRVKFHASYRSNKGVLTRLERRFLETPGKDLEREVFEQQGFLRGLLKGLEFLELKANDNRLPGIM